MQIKFEPRKLMERAIEVMRQSVREPRSDGKLTPYVGAVIYKPDGSIDTACRGELRSGDHAEFGLLERKNRHNRLDGSIMFATLEPCAPGARNHPKLSCAERIVLARIQEVWVGIEDPDPTVDRKGIQYLQDNGVTVHMFDRDLQEVIREQNKEFFEQASARAEAAADGAKVITLSSLEKAVPQAEVGDLSMEALEQYRKAAQIEEAVVSGAFLRRLVKQGLFKEAGAKVFPSGFGLLLFGHSPREIMPQAGLLGTIHDADGREDQPQNFEGPLVHIPEQVLQWLRNKLPNPVERSEARRYEVNKPFYELVREGIVNALVHRDYAMAGAKCHLIVTPETIVIKSPGKPVEPITLEQLQSFNAPMLSRNPVLHYVFGKMELAEERGLGLKSLKLRTAELGLPLPKYSWENPYLVLTLYRNVKSATATLAPAILEQLSPEEQKGWTFLSGRSEITQSEYAGGMAVTARTAQRHLSHFVELGLLRREGRGPATKYLKS